MTDPTQDVPQDDDEMNLPDLPDPDTAEELEGENDGHTASRARAGHEPRPQS